MSFFIPLGILYGGIIDLRNYLYDKQVFKSHDLGARTISVGNLTTGGTGKTPLVAYIAKLLAESGEKVCILTRGYGRKNVKERVLVSNGNAVLADAETGGDEPVELALKLLGKAIVVADADRVAAAEWTREKFGVTAFILDDGFQHRRAKRDLDIVCVDATNPCGGGRVLPAGRLRESFDGIARADAIVITRSDQIADLADLRERLRSKDPKAPIFEASNVISAIKSSGGNLENGAERQRCFAFCGLGNPSAFFEMLRANDLQVQGSRAFADHHRYTQADAESIGESATESGADVLLTTSKDAVKLKDLRFELPCFIVEVDVELTDANEFRKLITSS